MTAECNLPRDSSGGIDYQALAKLLSETRNLQDQADILHILFKDKLVSSLAVSVKMPSIFVCYLRTLIYSSCHTGLSVFFIYLFIVESMVQPQVISKEKSGVNVYLYIKKNNHNI